MGGYGRREPAAGSDLDLLLLHRDGVDVTDLADSLWYPIWDAGVGLDHSVRTVDQALAVARTDLKAALGLLDGRHVAGDLSLTARLHESMYAAWRREAGKRLPELVTAVRERAERVGELAFLLEPDLKEARGGLRDVHAIRAIAAAWVADAPDDRVLAAYEWLLDVRGELHRRSARGSDRLVQQEQGPVGGGPRRGRRRRADAPGVRCRADDLVRHRRSLPAGRREHPPDPAVAEVTRAGAAPARRRSGRTGRVGRARA